MIDIPVVLVLGAGASKPYGFPLGQELVDEAIARSGSIKPILAEIDDALAMQLDEFLRELRAAHPDSIDAFLEARHPQFEQVGKAVIAYHLMKNEHVKKLEEVPREEDWYQHLLYKMLLTDGYDGIGFNQIAILTYNYDRSLEYAIFKMLRGLGHSEEACRKGVEALYIRHLHGQIGCLPELHDEGRRYEPKVDAARLKLAMRGIQIVHEPVENNRVFQDAHLYLRQAKHVIFLGFGYLERNVERLNLQDERMKHVSYWGTGVNVTAAEAQQYARLFPKHRSGDGPHFITIDTDTGVKSVKTYIRKHLYLFTQ